MSQISIETQEPNNDITIEVDPTIIGGGIGLTVSLTLAWLWKYIAQPRIDSMRYNFRRSVATDFKINGKLYLLLEKYKATRVIFYQAHNGETYSSGQHIWKVSISHEALRNGITSTRGWNQSTPSIDFINSRPGLIEKGVCFANVEDSENVLSPKFKNHLIEHGIVSQVTHIARGYNKDEIIGFLEIHWDELETTSRTLEELKQLKTEVNQLSGLLLKKDENLFAPIVDFFWQK